MSDYTDAELAAFLDEALPPARCSELEHQLRTDDQLRNRLVQVRGRETAGLHEDGVVEAGDVPRGVDVLDVRLHVLVDDDAVVEFDAAAREELGQYLLGTLEPDKVDYIRFHIDQVGCRYCEANLADLQQASAGGTLPQQRRRRYFETSAGYLKK